MADPQRVRLVFLEAVERHTPDQWSFFLDEACGADQELRKRVEVLLRAHDEANSMLDVAPPLSATTDQPVAEHTGTVVGPYKLIEPIGEGGMGSVWMAQQTAPVKRLVAVKLIKAGMDSKQVIARFEAERQALALMDHPNIARVLDAGTTEAGRPYFVMDLVKGVSITKYCDDHHLTPRQRLELFIPVCQAVQHAHQKGIIHRDIKPSNVLVALYDGKPVPKVIDFGVAKAAGHQLTDKTLVTGFGAIVGTLEYMSPEQAETNQLDIDTRSDIYSLGVLLYELLTGSTPFSNKDLEKAGMLEMLRVIREDEPSKPSTKLSSSEALPTLSANRGTEPAKLTRLVRGELDWIVMRALEKDRSRRYETANGFAADVQRYLADETVQACPPSAGYRLRKFARRNKGPVLAAAVVLVALVGGIVATTWGLLRAESARKGEAAERRRAEQENQIAQAIRDFLQKKLLLQADTRHQADALLEAGGRSAEAKYNPTIRELLDRAAAELVPDKIETQFPNQPLVQAGILHTIGVSYRGIGEYGPAIDHLKRAHALLQAQLGPDHLDTLITLHDLAVAYREGGKLPEAVRLLEQVRDKQVVNLGPDHPHTLSTMESLAGAYSAAGKLPEAVALHEVTLKLSKVKLGPDHSQTLETMNGLAATYADAGRFKEALALNEETLKLREVKLGPYHPDTLSSMYNLACAFHNANQLKDAIALHKETLKLRSAGIGPYHPHTLTSMDALGRAYSQANRFKEAIALHEETLELRKAKLGHDHPWTLMCMNSLGWAYEGDGRLRESLTLYEEALKLSEVKLGRDHPHTLMHMFSLAAAYRGDGRFEEAVALLEETLKLREAKLGPHHWRTLLTMQALALAYEGRGDHAKAERLLRDTLALQKKILGTPHPRVAGTLAGLGRNLRKQQKYAEAEPVQREGLAIRVQLDPDDWGAFNAKSMLGDALLGQKKYAEAEPLLLQGYEGMKQREAKIPRSLNDRLTQALERLVLLYEAQGNADEAGRWRAELAARKVPPKEEKKPPPKKQSKLPKIPAKPATFCEGVSS